MMNYSKTREKGSSELEPLGFIEVIQEEQRYLVTGRNIISIDDKVKIVPKLEEIARLDLTGL